MRISDHKECLKLLGEAQENETDNREMSMEADLFLNKRDGQWEPQVLNTFKNRPKYTFDECNPIVDGIVGEIRSRDFGITISPAGGQASKEVAKVLEGMVRTIQRISKPSADHIFNTAARVMVGTGFDAWRVINEYRDDDSFNQDLMIQHIPNAQQCVWFDPNAVLQDMSDSEFAWCLTSLTGRVYDKKYPKGSRMSVEQGIRSQAYPYKKPEEIIIGECLYKKTKYRTLVQMSNGDVYVENEDFQQIVDELKAADITVNKTRKRPYDIVYQRHFDGSDWLTDEKETVFCYVPIVPVFGNFRITENKIIYWGIVEKLMDPQRVINYSESRKIEEGALAPKGKVWMSKEQAKSDSVKRTLSTLNTNNDPVQFYDYVEGQNPPSYVGSPASNPSLIETTQTAQNFVQRTSGTYDEDRGTAPPRRSGIAIEKLQVKSDSPKSKWFESLEIAIAHTCDIIVKAIPKVYDTMQTITLTGKDGTLDVTTLYKPVRDAQTGKIVYLNDLSQGKYSVACKSGPAFQTKQAETVAAITDYAQIDPTVLQLGGDLLLNNINSPGIDVLAARKRRQMLLGGLIPPNEWTEEEKVEMQQQQANKDADMTPLDKANMMLAQAEMTKAQSGAAEKAAKVQLEQTKLQLEEVKLQLSAQKDRDNRMLEAMKQLNEQVKLQAETLKLIREASGADVITTPTVVKAFEEQARELSQTVRSQ
jgi:hypothetical protein